jgi:hypothetical protein
MLAPSLPLFVELKSLFSLGDVSYITIPRNNNIMDDPIFFIQFCKRSISVETSFTDAATRGVIVIVVGIIADIVVGITGSASSILLAVFAPPSSTRQLLMEEEEDEERDNSSLVLGPRIMMQCSGTVD